MIKDINIYVTPYDWNSLIALKECNFFSGESYTQLAETIDLKNFMLESDRLVITKNEDAIIVEGASKHSLKYLADSIDVTLSDWKKLFNGTYLRDFFYLYSTSATYDRVKFLVQFYYAGDLVFQGIIPREWSEKFSAGDSDRTIEMTILSWEKEFRDYFKKKPLPVIIFTSTKHAGSTFGDSYLPLLDVLEAVFPDLTITIPETSISDWRVCEYPEFYRASDSDPLYFPRCGYENVRENNENCFDFLNKLCAAMGWVWGFSVNGSDLELYIKNRNTQDSALPLLQIGKKDILSEFTASRLKDHTVYNSVFINDGNLMGGDEAFPNGNDADQDHRGDRLVVISNTAEIENNPLHFSNVEVDTSPKYTLESSDDDTFSRWWQNEDDYASYAIYEYTSSTANDRVVYPEPKEITLFVNGGHNDIVRHRVQLTDGGEDQYSTLDPTTDIDDYDLIYSGNYGQMLYQFHSSTPYHYSDYAQGTAFGSVAAGQLAKNYKSYLAGTKFNLEAEIVLKTFDTNSLQVVQTIINERPFNVPANNKWGIKTLEADAMNDTTKLQLVA